VAARNTDGIHPLLLAAFAVAAAGGPWAIAALYLPTSTGLTGPALVRATLLGVALFAAPLAIWIGYGRRIQASGGLYSYARAAAGPAFAWVQGLLWSFSYLLYLPYTVTYIVYYLLPAFAPTLARPPLAPLLQLALPIAFTALVAAPRRVWLVGLAGSAALQLAAIALFAPLALLRPARAAAAATAHPLPLAGGAAVASLFVCISLVLYLGGEVTGGARPLERALLGAFAVTAAATVAAALVLAPRLDAAVRASNLPGTALARTLGAPGVAVAVGALAVLSVAGLIAAEYVALTRLWGEMFGLDRGSATWAIGAWFLLSDAAGLLHPHRFYNLSLPPSLVALFASQAMVFAAYPLLLRREGKPLPLPLLLGAVALAWALFSLYQALVTPGG
jgi:amino acid transporter